MYLVQIRIFSNMLFHFHLRRLLAEYRASPAEMKQQVLQTIDVTDEILYQCYSAIMHAKMPPGASRALKASFNEFCELAGVQDKINVISAEAQNRGSHFIKLVTEDSKRMFSNWKSFIKFNPGIYAKQWVFIKLDENRDRAPRLVSLFKSVVTAGRFVSDVALLGESKDINVRYGNYNNLPADLPDAEKAFLQELVDELRSELETAGATEFPLPLFSETVIDGKDKKQFQHKEAVKLLPLVHKIVIDMDAVANRRAAEYELEGAALADEDERLSRNILEKISDTEWRTNGPYRRPLAPHASNKLLHIHFGGDGLAEWDEHAQLQLLPQGVHQFSTENPYKYPETLQGSIFNIKHGQRKAKYTVGTDQYSGVVVVQESDGESTVTLGHFVSGNSSIETTEDHLRACQVDFEGTVENVSLHAFLEGAIAVALAKEIFDVDKVIRVNHHFLEYDHRFSTDGGKVCLHFHGKVNDVYVREVERKQALQQLPSEGE
jgi:hypothetical protein